MFCWLCRFLKSSIARKQIMALTGLALCGFLISHLLGNFLIFRGAEAFNSYAHALIHNPFIIPAEIGLASVFLIHILLAIKLTLENSSARPQKYEMKVPTGRGQTFASVTMPISGLIILVFLILHLIQFKYGATYTATYSGVEMRDLHRLVLELFGNPIQVVWYVFAMIVLGLHVCHGFQSAFQSLGLNHPKYTPIIKCLSKLYALFISVGFSSIPIWCFVKGGL